MVIVFVMDISKNFFQLLYGFVDKRVILLFQTFFQIVHNHVRATEFNSPAECFCQVVILTGHRHCLAHNRIDFFYYTFVFRLAFGELSEFLLLFCFRTQHIIINDSLIHTDRVLPVVAAAGILVGILDTGFVAGGHHFFQYGKTCATNGDAWLVLCLHTFFYFRYGEVAACTSGESHNHGIVTFFQSFDGDGQVFRSFQGHV